MGGNPQDTRHNSRRGAEYGLQVLKLTTGKGLAPSIPLHGVTDEFKRTTHAGARRLSTKLDKSASTHGVFPGHAMTPRALWPQ